VLIVFGFILVCLPFWLHLHSVTGNWQLSGSSHYQDFGLRYDQSRGVNESKVIFDHMESLFEPDRTTDMDPDHKPMGMGELIVSHPDRFLGIIRFNLIDGYHEALKTARYLSLSPAVFFCSAGGRYNYSGCFIFFRLLSPPTTIGHRLSGFDVHSTCVFLIMQTEHRYFFPFISSGPDRFGPRFLRSSAISGGARSGRSGFTGSEYG